MADQGLPGFKNDGGQSGKKAAKPSTGFNAFDDVEVQANNPLAPPPAPAAPPKAKPATGRTARAEAATTPGFDAFADDGSAPSASAQAAVEANIKPGAAKDLWACPHCGAKNKPDRNSCRECGKSPSDPVIIPWHQPLPVRLGLGAGGLAVLLLVGWLMIGGSVSLVPAEAGHIDSKPRVGGSVGPEADLSDMHFQPRERWAVCGRLVASERRGELSLYFIALGTDAKDAESLKTVTVDFSAVPPRTTPEIRGVAIAAFGQVPDAQAGDLVSVVGDKGLLTRDARILDEYDGTVVLRVLQSAP